MTRMTSALNQELGRVELGVHASPATWISQSFSCSLRGWFWLMTPGVWSLWQQRSRFSSFWSSVIKKTTLKYSITIQQYSNMAKFSCYTNVFTIKMDVGYKILYTPLLRLHNTPFEVLPAHSNALSCLVCNPLLSTCHFLAYLLGS